METKDLQKQKEILQKVPAGIRIGSGIDFKISAKENFVRLAFQSRGGGVESGGTMFVFDHRDGTMAFVRENGCDWGRQKQEEFLDVVNTPAWVEVARKTDGEREFCYMNLYDISPEEGTDALLSVTVYAKKRFAHYAIRKDYSLFSWGSTSTSRSGMHEEFLFLVLTDKENCAAVYIEGYENVEHRGPQVVCLGSEYEEIAADEYDIQCFME
jgi:hypothetical protein